MDLLSRQGRRHRSLVVAAEEIDGYHVGSVLQSIKDDLERDLEA